MPIHHFKVLQKVLTQTRNVICNQFGLTKQEAFEKAELFIKENSKRWRLPNPEIEYEDPFCRMAYLYMNVAVHATLVEQAIDSFNEVERIIDSKIISGDELRICALGGGPGSELLGVVRYIEKHYQAKNTAYLDFLLVDRIKEWDESWHALKTGVDQQLKNEYGKNRNQWPVSVSRSFLPLDVTAVSDFKNFATRFNGTDIFFLCYIVSELKAFTPEFEKVISLLVNRANSRVQLVFIDRDEKKIRDMVKEIVNRIPELTFVAEKKERGQLQDDLTDLGEWYINLPSLPRQKWFTFYVLAQKK